jgi:hypothetical protein
VTQFQISGPKSKIASKHYLAAMLPESLDNLCGNKILIIGGLTQLAILIRMAK